MGTGEGENWVVRLVKENIQVWFEMDFSAALVPGPLTKQTRCSHFVDAKLLWV